METDNRFGIAPVSENLRGETLVYLMRAVADYARTPAPNGFASIQAAAYLLGANEAQAGSMIDALTPIIDALHPPVVSYVSRQEQPMP